MCDTFVPNGLPYTGKLCFLFSQFSQNTALQEALVGTDSEGTTMVEAAPRDTLGGRTGS